MDITVIRNNIRIRLKEQKLTLNALSNEANLSEDTLRSLLYGHSKDIKLSTILKIAEVLESSVDELADHSIYPSSITQLVQRIARLPNSSLQRISALLTLEEATALPASQQGNNLLPIFVPTGNMKDGYYYDGVTFDTLDITGYPESLKREADFGIRIRNSNLEPVYYYNDILLMTNARLPDTHDTVMYLDSSGRIYLRSYTDNGLAPINRYGNRIAKKDLTDYTFLGIVLKSVREFNIENYR